MLIYNVTKIMPNIIKYFSEIVKDSISSKVLLLFNQKGGKSLENNTEYKVTHNKCQVINTKSS